MRSVCLASFLLTMVAVGHDLAQQTRNYQVFETEALEELGEASGKRYLGFLDEASMSAGLYRLPQGGVDDQSPHPRDEVYYIASGEATLTVAGDLVPLKRGSIIYVKAHVAHRFENITRDLTVLVIFSKTPFDEDDPDWQAFHLDEIRREKKPDENVWNLFLDVATLRFGLYMLPEALGGDSALTHEVDEVNIVVRGEARFRMGENETRVRPGSIVWVRHGIGHSFDSLSEDFEVLILFEK